MVRSYYAFSFETIQSSYHLASDCLTLTIPIDVVTLGAYRVFPCKGSSKDDVIIAALEKAYTDGMDVVNLSLGEGFSWANTALSKVAGHLANLGVVVVAAIGNDGELGIDEVSSPSINHDAISVASFEGSGYLSNYFEVKGASDTRIGNNKNTQLTTDYLIQIDGTTTDT